MKRVDDFLSSNEKVQLTVKPDFFKTLLSNKVSVFGIFSLVAVIFGMFSINLPAMAILFPIILLIVGLIPTYIKCHFTTYYITNQKVLIETGIIGLDYDIIKKDRILDVNLDVSVVDSLLGTGSVKLCTANDTEPVKLIDVRNPKKVIKIIQF